MEGGVVECHVGRQHGIFPGLVEVETMGGGWREMIPAGERHVARPEVVGGKSTVTYFSVHRKTVRAHFIYLRQL